MTHGANVVSQVRTDHTPRPLPQLRSPDPSWKPNSGLTPEPLGPGGGRPLSPGRASEHVQTGRPFARSAPAARSTPRPRLSSAPAGSATAQRGSPQPGGAVQSGPGRVGVLTTGAAGVRASGLRALRGCGLGALEGGRPSRPRSRGESCIRGPSPRTLAQAASWIYPVAGKQVCVDTTGSARGCTCWGTGRTGGAPSPGRRSARQDLGGCVGSASPRLVLAGGAQAVAPAATPPGASVHRV